MTNLLLLVKVLFAERLILMISSIIAIVLIMLLGSRIFAHVIISVSNMM